MHTVPRQVRRESVALVRLMRIVLDPRVHAGALYSRLYYTCTTNCPPVALAVHLDK